MKYLLILLLFLFAGCGVKTSGNIDVDPNDIKFIKKGKVCFAIVASRKAGHFSTSGLGLAYVPCNKI